jgi:hypothetical protein
MFVVLILDNFKGGPPCKFSDSDVLFLLDYLRDGKRVSRIDISRYLGIGEGSVRKLIELLKENNMVETHQTGNTIKPYGIKLLETLDIKSVSVNVGGYVVGRYQQGVIVKDMAEKVFNGIAQRNAGIRAGGEGCTTWIMDQNNLLMMPAWNVDKNDSLLSMKIRKSVEMEDGDVLIIGGGDTKRFARLAAGSAALELV